MEKEIELLPFLERVMKRTTKHYQEDFHSDFARLQRAAKDPEDEHIFYWMARPCGTWIVTERDAFLKGSFGHAAWTHYADMAAGIRAYRVTVTGRNDDMPLGTVRKLDYPEQVKRVMANALHAERIEFTYPSGERRGIAIEKYRQEREWLFYKYGMPCHTLYCPHDENELQCVLAAEQLCQKKRQTKAKKKPPKGPSRE